MNKYSILLLIIFIVGCQPRVQVIQVPVNNTIQVVQNNTITNTTQIVNNIISTPTLHYGNLTVYFMDVGQGDGIFIITPNNKTILIDGGEENKGVSDIEFIRNLGFFEIDYIILTHPDSDHLGALTYIIPKMRPKIIFDNGQEKDTNLYSTYKSTWTGNHQVVSQDISFEFDNLLSSMFIVPFDDGNGFSSNVNENSVLLKLTYKNINFLFTGDCEEDCEARVGTSNLKSDVLKVGHHGSCTSSKTYFLNKINPKYAVIQVGKDNQYNHPCSDVLSRLTNIGSNIYRNDIHGFITITTDGDKISVFTQK